jgi:hypothetical protein
MRGLRNGRCEKKCVVEDCLILSVKDVRRGTPSYDGMLRWRRENQDIAGVRYSINLWSADRGGLWLWYNVDGAPIHVAISMISTALPPNSLANIRIHTPLVSDMRDFFRLDFTVR